MASPLYTATSSIPSSSSSAKKHKKHKSDKRERFENATTVGGEKPPGLKLILKVGGGANQSATPEHTTDFTYNLTGASSSSYSVHHHQPLPAATMGNNDESSIPMDTTSGTANDDGYFAVVEGGSGRSHHKKSKKKKKKKDKNKERGERKHRHHHKEKKRKRGNEDAAVVATTIAEIETAASNDENHLNHTNSNNTGVGGAIIAQATTVSIAAIDLLGSPNSQHREPRTCVLRQRQERTSLQKMLDQLLALLEKKDPQQFFAWPVTDNIAPGYSSIITQPMDISTMRQKIEENLYGNLQDFVRDFKLMCTNAMKYNHIDTIYYKASKKLLHAGTKLMQPEKLSWLLNLIPDLTSEDMGFEITAEFRQNRGQQQQDEHEDSDTNNVVVNNVLEVKKRMPATKFEAIPDDLTPEEILAKSQIAAREARAKLMLKQRGGAIGGGGGLSGSSSNNSATMSGVVSSMGFLKQRKDGTTNLNILVGGDGVIPGTKKRPVLLGQLAGKLSEGTGQLQGFREDRRNIAKPVKPLYYGAFGSYAPSYDSAFANLSKDESDLIYQTYGSDTAVQYAESVLDFVKDSDYATHLVDSLLDLLTGGDHTKTKQVLEENKNMRDEEEAVRTMLEIKPLDGVKVDVDELRSLQDLGININFLETMDDEIRAAEERHELQQRLDSMCQLLEKLQHTQHQRLSAPSPLHLSLCAQPSDEELQVAANITDSLNEIAKRVSPGDIAPVAAIRKALGVALPTPPSIITTSVTATSTSTTDVAVVDVPDLESELRQFLESEPALTQSPLRDDKTIEEILME